MIMRAARYRYGSESGRKPSSWAVTSLRDDLASGRWAERNRDIVALDAAELSLRLVVA